MFIGPPGSGKSSLMDRLLGRKIKKFSLSTGVAESVVIVDIDIDNPSTFHSVTVVDCDTWKEIGYDESIVRQLNKQPSDEAIPEEDEARSSEPSGPKSVASPVLMSKTKLAVHDGTGTKSQPSTIFTITPHIRKMINSVIKKCGGRKQFKRFLKKSFSLYLRDTGGQVEFQEILPLLIVGPSIFFFVFKLDSDLKSLKSKFTVRYRESPSETYKSSITIEEALLHCLASVYAMDTPSEATVKTHNPLVFIIATHKDLLGPSADEIVSKLDAELDSLLKSSHFQNLVEYADTDDSKRQVMFTVNNN